MANHSEYGTKTLSVRVSTKDYVKVIEAAEAKKLSTSEYVTYKLFREEAEAEAMRQKIKALEASNAALTKDLVGMRGTVEQLREVNDKEKGKYVEKQNQYSQLLTKWNDLVSRFNKTKEELDTLKKKADKKGFWDV